MSLITCKVCGAEIFWDTKTQSLKCEYCGAEIHPSELGDVEQAKAVGKIKDNSKGNLVQYKCEGCGANLVTQSRSMSSHCTYCGRVLSLGKNVLGVFNPQFIVPFSINKQQAISIYKEYMKQNFRFSQIFQKDNNDNNIKGLYVPYWLHSFGLDANYELDCHEIEQEKHGDNWYTYYPEFKVNVNCNGSVVRLPTDAEKQIDNKLIDQIEPFDYTKMQKFHPGYLAGFHAQAYDVGEEESRLHLATRINEEIYESICRTLPEYAYIDIKKQQNNIQNYKIRKNNY